jgi:tRNA-dihydrouridine synthase A
MRHNDDDNSQNVSRYDIDAVSSTSPIKELHIAPMLNVSTVEFRAFMRILTKRCIIWTEMIVDETLYFNRQPTVKTKQNYDDTHEHDRYGNDETGDPSSENCWTVPQHLLYPVLPHDHPVICQIGSINPEWTEYATQCIIHANYNYNEININLDCPSTRVQGKQFGAILMKDITKTIVLLQSIQKYIPSHMCVSVKCRIGIIDMITNTDWDWIVQFIHHISTVCQRFIVHARPVILSNHMINPKQNRSIPPLNYCWVYKLCHLFPQCEFIMNGGISDLYMAKRICYGIPSTDTSYDNTTSIEPTIHRVPCDICQHPANNGSCIVSPTFPAPTNLRGCMLGRAAIDHPIQFAKVDQFWYGENIHNNDKTYNGAKKATTRRQVIEQYCQYLDQLYPRRCCDNDDTIITMEIPSPNITFIEPYCTICKEFRQLLFQSSTIDRLISNEPCRESTLSPKATIVKIVTKIIDRSIKPILNIFHEQNGSKVYKHQCEMLRRDLTIRNCGPAYIIYCATIQQSNISDHILDQSIA